MQHQKTLVTICNLGGETENYTRNNDTCTIWDSIFTVVSLYSYDQSLVNIFDMFVLMLSCCC